MAACSGDQEMARKYTAEDLKEKIREFNPELDQKGMNLEITWDEAGQRFALKLSQAGQETGAYLDQKDAEECISGERCLNLVVLVTQLVAELEDRVTPRKPG
jgi:23S rRNA G2069 N7-methylase RlmK/C1962 C5-methylase RlmI